MGISKYYMNYEEASNVISKLKELFLLVKSYNITTKTKKEHFHQLEQMRKLLYACGDVCCLYEPDNYFYFTAYKRNVEANSKKVHLDAALIQCKNRLLSDIKAHIIDLNNLRSEILENKTKPNA